MQGTVKAWKDTFGFIKCDDDGTDLFVHWVIEFQWVEITGQVLQPILLPFQTGPSSFFLFFFPFKTAILENPQSLRVGDRVEFHREPGKKGLEAHGVRLVDTLADAVAARLHISDPTRLPVPREAKRSSLLPVEMPFFFFFFFFLFVSYPQGFGGSFAGRREL